MTPVNGIIHIKVGDFLVHKNWIQLIRGVVIPLVDGVLRNYWLLFLNLKQLLLKYLGIQAPQEVVLSVHTTSFHLFGMGHKHPCAIEVLVVEELLLLAFEQCH